MENEQIEDEQYDDEYGEEEEDDDDSSDDDVGLLKPAFDLQALRIQEDAMKSSRNKSDLNGPPADGLEYLLQVRKEARTVPDVVVASRKVDFVTTTTDILSMPAKESRTISEIQRKQLLSFASARRMVLDARAGSMSSGTFPPVQPANDESEGDEEMEVEGENKEEKQPNSMSICEKLGVESNQPLITTMLRLDQDELSELLDEFADKVGELPQQNMQCSTEPWPLGRWIFSSLAAVDEPASAENLAAMRNLAKRCLETSRALQSLSNAESFLVDIDLFVLIVVVHFKQMDLIDIVSSE